MYTWKVVRYVKKPYLNAEHIFPTQQKYVEELIEHAKTVPSCTEVIIFGSSVFPCCMDDSDVDCYIKGCTPREWGFFGLSDYVELDIVFDTEVNGNAEILNEIRKDGVCVYKR